MKILTKYTLKEFIAPFFLGLFCFTFILLLNDIFRLTKIFVQKGVSAWYLVELLIYVLPAALVVTIPMATLVGLLLVFGRLSADNEITAMKAGGIGVHQLLPPVLLASLGISIFNFFFMDTALPKGNVAYSRLLRDIQVRNSALILEPGIVMDELENEGRKWMFDWKNEKTGRLENVKIWDEYRNGKPRFITAKEAEVDFSGEMAVLKLYDGFTYEAGRKNSQDYQVINFKEMQLIMNFNETLQYGEYEVKNPRSMSLAVLSKYMKETREKYGEENKDYLKYQLLRAQVEYQKKFAIPFASLAFSLIGVPLGIMVRRSGKMIGAGIGLGLIIIYYMLLRVGETTGLKGVIPPPLAIWMPNILIGIAGIILTIRAMRETPMHPHRWLGKLFPMEAGRESDSESYVENP